MAEILYRDVFIFHIEKNGVHMVKHVPLVFTSMILNRL